jgi:hypothetical protein
MVCYVRPSLRMMALILVIVLVFGRRAGHFLGSSGLIVTIAVVAAAAVAVGVTLAFVLRVRRQRALAGGCVHCRFRCQHAMTEQSRLLVLRSSVDSDRTAAPQWPDRPAYRSKPTLPQEERADSAGSTVGAVN